MISIAAKNSIAGEQDIVIAGGLESISLVQNKHKNSYRFVSKAVLAQQPTAYIPMIETAELVAERYGIPRAQQDEYALQSQQRTAEAQQAGSFDDENVPRTARKRAGRERGREGGG